MHFTEAKNVIGLDPYIRDIVREELAASGKVSTQLTGKLEEEKPKKAKAKKKKEEDK